MSSSESETDIRPRRPRNIVTTHRPTRRQLRAVAPDGLIIEDILRRIEFDEELPSEAFTVLVDPVDHTARGRPATPPGAKWCRRFCWTGDCARGDQCWYSHGGMPLVPWGLGDGERLMSPPGSNKAPLAAMVELSLNDFGSAGHCQHTICFLLFDGRVVWGRDIAGFGAELWSKFVKSRRGSGDHFEEIDTVETVGEWKELPYVLLCRVVRALPANDLAACILAFGHAVDWAEVVDERWPCEALSQKHRTTTTFKLEPLLQAMSLVEVSRLAAQLLHGQITKQRAGQNFSASPLSSTPLPFSSACPPWCMPVSDWTLALCDPACIRFDSTVHSFCFDTSLIMALTIGDILVAIRREDLKRMASVKVRHARCFDFRSDALLVGTKAPAHVLSYDLSVAAPKVKQKLCIDGGNRSAEVVSIFFTSEGTCACGVMCRERLIEVVILSCQESLTMLRRLPLPGTFLCGELCLTSSVEGELSFCDPVTQAPTTKLELPKSEANWLRTTIQSEFSIVRDGAEGLLAVVDNTDEGSLHQRIHAYEFRNVQSPIVMKILGPIDSASEPCLHRQPHFQVVDMHIEGQLLVVLTIRGCRHELGTSEEESISCRLFAWHLLSGRPIISDYPTPWTMTFGRSRAGSCGLISFAACYKGWVEGHDNNCNSNFISMPTAGGSRRVSRRQNNAGNFRRAVSGSDVRARGIHKQGRQKQKTCPNNR